MDIKANNDYSVTLESLRGDELQKIKNQQELKKIKETAKDFESLFLDIVMKSMRQTVKKSGFIDGGNAENIYQSMLDSEYSKSYSDSSNSSLAKSIEDFLLKNMRINEDVSNKFNSLRAKDSYK